MSRRARFGLRVVLIGVLTIVAFVAWRSSTQQSSANRVVNEGVSYAVMSAPQNKSRLIHVVVALCDNEYQGIVPVPAKIGNGDDPGHNLYWGAGYGVKTFFNRAKDWSLKQTIPAPNEYVLERLVFKHASHDVWLVADAYRGREIQRCTHDFLNFLSGRNADSVSVVDRNTELRLYIGGSADLVAYIGHDGLMDFNLPDYPASADNRTRDAVILACASRPYFTAPLKQTGAQPLLWTNGLMAPEAYTLKAALDGWMSGEAGTMVHERAAKAYHSYQKCGLGAARRLFATGW